MSMIRFKEFGLVDVVDAQCRTRECFRFGFDKGVYVQGRGYTSYHKQELPVCMTRHLNGCPGPTICPTCRTVQLPGIAECVRCHVPVIPRGPSA